MSGDSVSFLLLLEDGDAGDTRVELRLSARELAAIQYVVTLATEAGLLLSAHYGAATRGVGTAWNIAFRQAEARIGIAIARALGLDASYLDEFTSALARFDQERAALEAEGEEHGD